MLQEESKLLLLGYQVQGKLQLPNLYQKLLVLCLVIYAHIVSTKKVMLEKISAGYGERYMAYINQPDLVPLEVIGADMVARLKRRDCLERGWVLDGYPFTHKEAEYLQRHGVVPNR